MLTSYFKIAWRNLVRHKAYSAINIGGLAVGMAVALLNGLWVWDELSFNQYHRNYDSIGQVMKRGTGKDNPFISTGLTYPLALELKNSYGNHFRHLLMAQGIESYFLAAGDNKVSKTGQYIEAGAPEMLSLKMLKGTRDALRDPYSIILSASAAKALFGGEDPMSRTVTLSGRVDVKVTGVYEDLPLNTAFGKAKFFVPWDLYVSVINPGTKQKGWDNTCLVLYAQIAPNAAFDAITAKIKDAELNKIRNLPGLGQLAASKPQLFLHPMKDWHLYSDFRNGVADRGAVYYVWMIGMIGAFVLLLACINFMNLSTARAQKRAREVGIRKAAGSGRGQLIYQFFSESFLVVLLAFGVALLLTSLSLPAFNDLSAKQMTMPWANPFFWLFSLVFILLTGLLAGSYPAFYLSSFQPVKVLKGTFRVGRLAAVPRQVLVVMQFTISVTLIICTLVVYRQIEHAKNRPVGYNRHGLLMIQMKSQDFYGKYEVLRSELKNTGAVYEVAQSLSPTTGVNSSNEGFTWKGKDVAVKEDFGTLPVTPEYGKTVGWQFVAGRDFSREFASDSAGFVVNEAAVKYMGLQNPVGETIRWDWKWGNQVKDFQIIGVVKDMVMESPFAPVRPTIFFLRDSYNWINIRIRPNVSAAEALPKIEAVFKKLVPSAPFEYTFTDQEYALKFAAEERIGKLAGLFASLAIFISCLGLFGLASFTAEQRTKEIGIRKVLGASVAHLWGLLSTDFLRLVLVSFLLAAPAAGYLLSGWLEQYTYRTRLTWWIFAGAGGGALLITLLTVSYQAIKTALTNPVKSLRNG